MKDSVQLLRYFHKYLKEKGLCVITAILIKNYYKKKDSV